MAVALCPLMTYAAQSGDFEWKARWISKEQTQSGVNQWMAFRHKVTLENIPSTVTARIAVDTKYWLWINGEMVVYEGGLKRGPSPVGTYYDRVEIAPWLKKGENLIAIAVWHMGRNGFSHIDSGSIGLLFQAEGEGVEILSQDDGTWQCSILSAYQTADTEVPNYRLPESNVRYDAREFEGDDDKWFLGEGKENIGFPDNMPYIPGEGPFGTLVERPIPLWKNYGVREYEKVERHGDTLVCKLPYNLHASPVLKVNAPAGKVITMFTDHNWIPHDQGLSAQYVTRDGVQEYEHLCWLSGEKMYYVVPEGVEVLEVKYRETGYDCEFAGSFRCDDPLLNKYYQKAARSLYVCMRDTYYDCPDRERAQWIGDEVNELGMAFYQLSPSANSLAVKGLKELCAWAKPDGSLYGPVPSGNWFKELSSQTLAFIGWYGARRLAFYSGDYSFVPEIYPAIHKYLHETWKLDEEGLPVYRQSNEIWDWFDGTGDPDREALMPICYYLALKAEKDFASKIGKASDAAADEAIMSRLVSAYNEKFWKGTFYCSEDHSSVADDRVQALAVLSGIAPQNKYPALLKVLKENRDAATYLTVYVLEAMCVMGHPEMAQELMHYRYPTIMKDECSTLWEQWNFEGSCNHAWTGSGVVIMNEYFAGIRPKDPGFKVFTVKPQMGNLKHIETSFVTRYGKVHLKLDRNGKSITAELTVPKGSIAELHSPNTGKVHHVNEGTHKVTL